MPTGRGDQSVPGGRYLWPQLEVVAGDSLALKGPGLYRAPNVLWAAEVGGDRVSGDPARGLRGEGTSVEVPLGPGLGIEVDEAIFQH